MAVKKSTTNTGMPKASTIRWYLKDADTTTKTIDVGETSGKAAYGATVRFKQPTKRTNMTGWQITYKYRCRYTPSYQKANGKKAEWSNWSTRRTPIATTYRGSDGKSKSYKAGANVPDQNYWLKSNYKIAEGTYKDIVTWSKQMLTEYDGIQFQFSVRSFNKSTSKVGSWVSQTLSVYRGAMIEDEVLVANPLNGVWIEFNYKWERNDGTIVVESIKDAEGNELLPTTFEKAVTIDNTRASTGVIEWYPYKKDGYKAGQVLVDDLTRPLVDGDVLTVTGYYKTADGIKTYFDFRENGKVYGFDATQIVEPILSVEEDPNKSYVKITAKRTPEFDADDYAYMKEPTCTATYKYGAAQATGTVKSHKSEKVAKPGVHTDDDIIGIWYFRPPFNTDVEYKVSLTNEWNITHSSTINHKIDFRGAMLNGTNPAAVTYNASLTASTKTENVSIELTHGRDIPFAVFGKGRSRTLTLKGYVIDSNDDKYHVTKYSKSSYLEQLAKNLNEKYKLRWSDGRVYDVVVTGVDFDYGRVGGVLVNTVTIKMEEVST